MRRKIPSLTALVAFEAAGRLGRMSLAANELCVTPGAVSRQIKALEESLGVSLISGSKHKPELSAAGQALLPQLSSAFDQIASAAEVASAKKNSTLHVACYNTLTAKWLLPRLHAFAEICPDADVRLASTFLDDERSLAHHDVVILAEPNTTVHGDGVEATLLFDEQLGVVGTPSLLKKFPIKVANDVFAAPRLHSRTRSDAWKMWAVGRGFKRAGLERGATYAHYYFTLEAALGGLGLCIAPWHLVMPECALGRVLAPLGFTSSSNQYVALRKRVATTLAITFCQWLKQEADAMQVAPRA